MAKFCKRKPMPDISVFRLQSENKELLVTTQSTIGQFLPGIWSRINSEMQPNRLYLSALSRQCLHISSSENEEVRSIFPSARTKLYRGQKLFPRKGKRKRKNYMNTTDFHFRLQLSRLFSMIYRSVEKVWANRMERIPRRKIFFTVFQCEPDVRADRELSSHRFAHRS